MVTVLFGITLAAVGSTVAAGPHASQVQELGHLRLDRPAHPRRPPTDGPAVTVYGYHPYWSQDPTTLDFDRLSHLAIFNVTLESDGSLGSESHWTEVAGDVVPLAHDYGVKVDLCVTAFDDEEMWAVLPYASVRATAVANLAELVHAYGADGVNVDFEGLDAGLADDFVAFVEELRAEVDEVFIATPSVDWNGAFDYDRLAQASDGLFIMGYGYHWSGGDPGPVAPLEGGDPWGDYSLAWSVEDYRAWGAPDDKIIVGLPLYGIEWPTSSDAVPGSATGSGWSVFWYEAADEVAAGETRHWEPVTETPYLLPGGTQLWYDDEESLAARIAWAVDEGLQGVGFWALGYEPDASYWDVVDELTAPAEPLPDDTGAGENSPPVALAGEPFMAYPGDTVILDGSASNDPEGASLTFRWTQVAGPPVAILRGNSDAPQFVAESGGVHTFELVVNDGTQFSAPDEVDVIVVDPAAGTRFSEAKGGCSTSPALGGLLGALLALASRRRRA